MPKPKRETISARYRYKGREAHIIHKGLTPSEATALERGIARIAERHPEDESRIVRATEGSKAIGFTSVSQEKWDRIFGKKKKK